jgi:hypothetical protein
MPRTRTRNAPALSFEALTVEGALISPPMLARIAARQAGEQTEADYGVPKGLTLRDEIARYFRIGQALFAALVATETPSSAATIRFVENLLRDVLGFADLKAVSVRTIGDRQFAVTLEALHGRVPIVVVPPADDIDRPSDHLPTDGRRRSAASALQDWLNANEAALWGLCCNGFRLRLVRDNASLTRPAYIEANLQAIFQEENFADFAAFWLLVHASRFGPHGALPTDCALEGWREAGQKEGVAARDRLRDGVEAALLSFGSGFLAHPENGPFREKLRSGELSLSDFFSQLLRLVYRLIFLLAAEDRDLLHSPGVSAGTRKLYARGYSLAALRESAVRRAAWDRHHDRWEALQITFAALARGEKRLGLPALDGLFAPGALPDLENTKLANKNLMEAIYRLAWLKDDSGLVPVNWRDMETEELGSVYESLLELTPRLTDDGRGFAFAEGGEAIGHTRKTTGSYYTPDSLVQVLLDSALDPVLNLVEAEADDAVVALLSVTVLDPACGSGHFLLAAARRIATRVARARSHGLPSPADYRHALRDVARACIYGVDRNPMAVELTKVALWIETVEPGRPLGFLDANIRCGDSLLGVFDFKALEQGIPDAAYKPLAGDDKQAAKIAGRINREQRESAAQRDLAIAQGAADFVSAVRAITAMREDDLAGVQARARAYEAVHAERDWWASKTACDLYVGAFLAPKHFRSGVLARAQTPDLIPTTLDVRTALAGRQADAQLVAKAIELAGTAGAFHWPLEFPGIVASGGFDVVLGNPPWERIKLQEQEFFAAREPEIAQAPNAAARSRLVAKLKDAQPGTRARALFEEFEAAKRAAEASSVFARIDGEDGGRFPLTGRGDVNTYALFAELFASLTSKRGRAGMIVPTGIATDATTAPFFEWLTNERRIAHLYDFENRELLFPEVYYRTKFCLMTLGRDIKEPRFAFFLTDPAQLAEPERNFTLSAQSIAAINPNTKTAPVFRARADAELTAKIYARVPVLIDETKGKDSNPWGVSFMRMFDMSNDSGLFRTAAQLAEAGFSREGPDWVAPKGEMPGRRGIASAGDRDNRSLAFEGESLARTTQRYVPLYEAKMVSMFDHRAASYGQRGDDRGFRVLPETSLEEYLNPNYEPEPYYYVAESLLEERVSSRTKNRWMVGLKDVTSTTNERTAIFAAIPKVAVGHTMPVMFSTETNSRFVAMYAGLNSLVLDYIAKLKVAGVHLTYMYLKQFPVLPPASYREADIAYIVPRVLELTYTSHSIAPFARDLGYDGPPFGWDEDRRAQLRAELDAWYARAYGLTRDELRYILDPADVKGADYPSETFRVLKTNEIRRLGEYRTARLVLEAWDRLERGELAA